MIGLQISCGPGITCSSIYGYLTVIMAFIIFIGSVYLLLSAVFGIRMGYLVLAVAFFGWMILFSAIWVFGTGAPNSKNLGPRGLDPYWHAIAVGQNMVHGSDSAESAAREVALFFPELG